jgi:hypothetical protein
VKDAKPEKFYGIEVSSSEKCEKFQLIYKGRPLTPTLHTPEIEFDEKTGQVTVWTA